MNMECSFKHEDLLELNVEATCQGYRRLIISFGSVQSVRKIKGLFNFNPNN